MIPPISAPPRSRARAPLDPDRVLHRSALIIGIILYAAGTISFAGIFIAFFLLRLYAVSNESRITFMILFTGLFCAFQGLVFILMARSRLSQQKQMNFMLEQIRIIYSGSPGDLPPAPGRE